MRMSEFHILKNCFRICVENPSEKSVKGKYVNLRKHPQYWKETQLT